MNNIINSITTSTSLGVIIMGMFSVAISIVLGYGIIKLTRPFLEK